MNTRLLATKFHLPPLRAAGVTRQRLLERLDAGLHEKRKLTLVSAPAGYGKTTLVSGWIHSLSGGDLRTAWLSLDEADNDPGRFFSYWLGAFRQVSSSLGGKILPLLGLPQPPPLEALLDELLNELAALQVSIALTLDDYHLITNPQIHSALEYFVDHQPARVHLILAAREDPPLPLPRLRVRGQLTEIRARDLRFTPQEARQFFDLSLELSLSEETLRALDERTEGWAAGLQLAALALQHQPDPAAFIETFRGSHRYVLDYLAEEVIRQQDEEIRQFLAQTCVLEPFNAAACEALSGRADSRTLLHRLEQANLFIIPLDDEREWYRYHRLFADYLRAGLAKSEAAALYQKAALWHEANGMAFEAARYALSGGEMDFAADIIERALGKETTWSGGNIALLSSWLDALPPHTLHSRPQLSLNASRIFYLSGRFELAEKCIAQAEQALRARPAAPETEQMLALGAVYRGAIAAVRGDVEQAIEQTTSARARLSPENHLAHGRALFSLGLAYEISGQSEDAVQNYLQASDEAKTAGVLFLAIHARCAAAQVQISQGRLRLAEQSCRSAIELADGARIPPLGLAWVILGWIALEQNDLPSAGRSLQDGIELARQGGLMDDVILGLAYLSRLYAVQGNASAALAAAQEASPIIRTFGVARMSALASAYLARIQLYLGQKQAAAQWAAEYQTTRNAFRYDLGDLILARVLLATGELEALPAILHPLVERSGAAGQMQTCLEGMVLLGRYHHARQETQPALEWIEKSLRLAVPEGRARIFLDEGEPLLDLLAKARHAAPEFVDALLGMSRPEGSPRPAPLEQLPDPLSAQELRVLHLIVAGKSNHEIAAELVISVGTAKWHVHNVLQKLGVNNRPQAIARARELGV